MVVSGAVAGSPRVCTGSLIEESAWVLTAAHCVDGVAGYDVGVMHGYPEYTENRLADRLRDFASLNFVPRCRAGVFREQAGSGQASEAEARLNPRCNAEFVT